MIAATKLILAAAFAITAAYFVCMAAAMQLDAQCQSRWDGWGTSWSTDTGCLVQIGDGRWAPESNVKVTVK